MQDLTKQYRLKQQALMENLKALSTPDLMRHAAAWSMRLETRAKTKTQKAICEDALRLLDAELEARQNVEA